MASDIPQWALEKAEVVAKEATRDAMRDPLMPYYITVAPHIARALIQAEARGAERMKERAAAECDAVANDDGDRAARGFMTTEEQARRDVGRALAASIRNLEAKDAG